jgi:hypothetical protein
MARILVASIPVVGHVNPLVPVVRAVCARGHEVRRYTGAKYRSKVEAVGAQFVGLTHARDHDDAQIEGAFPGRGHLSGMAQLKFDMKHVFMDNGPGQLRDLQQIAQSFAPHVLLCEAGSSVDCSTASCADCRVRCLASYRSHGAASTLRRSDSVSRRTHRHSDASATVRSTGSSSMCCSAMCNAIGTGYASSSACHRRVGG